MTTTIRRQQALCIVSYLDRIAKHIKHRDEQMSDREAVFTTMSLVHDIRDKVDIRLAEFILPTEYTEAHHYLHDYANVVAVAMKGFTHIKEIELLDGTFEERATRLMSALPLKTTTY